MPNRKHGSNKRPSPKPKQPPAAKPSNPTPPARQGAAASPDPPSSAAAAQSAHSDTNTDESRDRVARQVHAGPTGAPQRDTAAALKQHSQPATNPVDQRSAGPSTSLETPATTAAPPERSLKQPEEHCKPVLTNGGLHALGQGSEVGFDSQREASKPRLTGGGDEVQSASAVAAQHSLPTDQRQNLPQEKFSSSLRGEAGQAVVAAIEPIAPVPYESQHPAAADGQQSQRAGKRSKESSRSEAPSAASHSSGSSQPLAAQMIPAQASAASLSRQESSQSRPQQHISLPARHGAQSDVSAADQHAASPGTGQTPHVVPAAAARGNSAGRGLAGEAAPAALSAAAAVPASRTVNVHSLRTGGLNAHSAASAPTTVSASHDATRLSPRSSGFASNTAPAGSAGSTGPPDAPTTHRDDVHSPRRRGCASITVPAGTAAASAPPNSPASHGHAAHSPSNAGLASDAALAVSDAAPAVPAPAAASHREAVHSTEMGSPASGAGPSAPSAGLAALRGDAQSLQGSPLAPNTALEAAQAAPAAHRDDAQSQRGSQLARGVHTSQAQLVHSRSSSGCIFDAARSSSGVPSAAPASHREDLHSLDTRSAASTAVPAVPPAASATGRAGVRSLEVGPSAASAAPSVSGVPPSASPSHKEALQSLEATGLAANAAQAALPAAPASRTEDLSSLMSSGVTPSAAPLASALPPAAPAAQREDVYSLRSQLEATRAQLQAALQDMHLMRTNVASGQPLPSPFKEAREAAMPLWKPALDGFKRGFVLAYGVRAGIGIVARALQLWRARQYSALGGWGLLSEKGLVYREDAVRLGLFVGGFTGLYHLLHEVLAARCGTPQNEGQICFIAGTVAGLTLLFQTGGRRRTLAMYMAARLAQCWYNSLKTQGRWHFWGSNWDYGDALLFALSSAQVMYAYVMRPETLPESYWRFIVRSGPIDAKVLEAVRSTNRGQPVNVEAVNAYVSAAGGATFLTSAFPRQIPAAILHPWTTSALRNFGKVTFDTFRKTFPLYMSLTLVPYVVLNLKRAAKAPVTTAVHAVLGALRSTSFLASFVGLYQGTISVHRALFPGDHKLLYYLAGLVASSAVLIEKRARRSELALYTLPRAVDSAFMTLMKRRWVPPMRFGEVGLFALCMGGLMYYREHEPHTMAPFLNTIISRIVFGQTKRDRPRMPRPSSIYFSQSDLPGGFGLADSPREPGENPNPNGGGAGGGNAAGPALDRSSPVPAQAGDPSHLKSPGANSGARPSAHSEACHSGAGLRGSAIYASPPAANSSAIYGSPIRGAASRASAASSASLHDAQCAGHAGHAVRHDTPGHAQHAGQRPAIAGSSDGEAAKAQQGVGFSAADVLGEVETLREAASVAAQNLGA